MHIYQHCVRNVAHILADTHLSMKKRIYKLSLPADPVMQIRMRYRSIPALVLHTGRSAVNTTVWTLHLIYEACVHMHHMLATGITEIVWNWCMPGLQLRRSWFAPQSCSWIFAQPKSSVYICVYIYMQSEIWASYTFMYNCIYTDS